MQKPFRILSLAGGGVRGIFQATFLSALEKHLKDTFSNRVDLVVGTSTGALVGLAVALKVPISDVIEFYRRESRQVFEKRLFSDVRKGPHYDQAALKRLLDSVYQGKRLRDAGSTRVVVTSAALDRFQHRLLSNIPELNATDPDISAAEAALASAAAPTYFAPVMLEDQQLSYVDGGVWANTPALLAILIAHCHLGVPLDSIHLLSIGTGCYPTGTTPAAYSALRPMSGGSIKTLFELMWSCQASFSDAYAELLLPSGHYIKADAHLQHDIPLDDVDASLSILPALAEQEAHRLAGPVGRLFAEEPINVRHRAPHLLGADLIPAAGLTAFYPSRDYYATHRREASSIDRYVATAQKTLMMVSINLSTGVDIDGVLGTLRRKLEAAETDFTVTLSLLNPFNKDLMRSLAPALPKNADELATSIKEALKRLISLKTSLPTDAQARFHIRVHNTIPSGSAILIDHRQNYGRIQIETKVYGAPFRQSFAFEVAPTGSSDLYDVLAKGYEDLVADGLEVTPTFLQRRIRKGALPPKKPVQIATNSTPIEKDTLFPAREGAL